MIKYHKQFIKSLKKQPVKIQEKFLSQLNIFEVDAFDEKLNNHALKGKLSGHRSFNVTSDVRVHYRKNGNSITIMKIGTHSQLY